jgi:hypothetical protein
MSSNCLADNRKGLEKAINAAIGFVVIMKERSKKGRKSSFRGEAYPDTGKKAVRYHPGLRG